MLYLRRENLSFPKSQFFGLWVVQQFTIPLPQRKRLDENEKDLNRGPRERKKGENSGSSNGLTRGRREKSRRKEEVILNCIFV